MFLYNRSLVSSHPISTTVSGNNKLYSHSSNKGSLKYWSRRVFKQGLEKRENCGLVSVKIKTVFHDKDNFHDKLYFFHDRIVQIIILKLGFWQQFTMFTF